MASEKNSSLKNLNLSWNTISDEGVKHISEAINALEKDRNTSLTQLNLSSIPPKRTIPVNFIFR